MKTYFTSDCHFFHANVIKYCSRPFKSMEEMNDALIKNWNSRVKPEDTVYHIGDFCFGKSSEAKESVKKPFDIIRKQLNGNIIFIAGNHDDQNGVKSKIQSLVLELGGYHLNLVHNPDQCDFNHRINLVGHVHEKWQIQKKYLECGIPEEIALKNMPSTICINTGVDVWNYYPVTWDEINSRLQKYLVKEQQEQSKIPAEFEKVINKNFWSLL